MSIKQKEASPPLHQLEQEDRFIHRHLGPSKTEIAEMLAVLGVDSLEDLIESTVPASILLDRELDLPTPCSEHRTIDRLQHYASRNQVYKSYIGMGYYDTHVPQVIQRNVLENPGWYTAYTPYQAEISQGRLEALLNFQQMVMDFTGMEMANASLLDEATAAAEAMTLCKRSGKQTSNTFFIEESVHPQTVDVVCTRAKYFGFDIIIGPLEQITDQEIFRTCFNTRARREKSETCRRSLKQHTKRMHWLPWRPIYSAWLC